MRIWRNWRFWLLLLAVAVGMSLFLLAAQSAGGLGFPLDDAWIHQTYARNVGINGRWEYTLGQPSAGSTAPLWTLLLAVGYLLRLPPLLWANLLGGGLLLAIGWLGMRLWRQLWPEWARFDWAVGVVLVLTWPLLWAAASGMETLLFTALGLFICDRYLTKPDLSPLLGLLSALLILVRPDGLVLLLTLILLQTLHPTPYTLRPLLLFALAFLLPLIPYFSFNMWSGGQLWPTTFYAKQAEYAPLLAQPLLWRLWQVAMVSLGGVATGRGMSSAHLLLLPGVFVTVWRWLQQRRWQPFLLLLWAGGHVVLYAWWLPLVYQHGRYLLPTVPVWVLLGLAGWGWLLGGNGRFFRILRQTAVLSFAIVLLFFLLQGAVAYGRDVAFIEGEMVAAARWLAVNTEPDVLVAAHDIGAIGYFAERPLLALAGLLSPEVVPLLPDGAALVEYALAAGAGYLVTAPGWPYRALGERGTAVYQTDFAWTREQGWENTAVYRLGVAPKSADN